MTYNEMKKILITITDPVEKLEMVMDFGKTLKVVPENSKCTEIVGCSSYVQICQKDNDFYGVADSALVRGIVAVLIAMLNGKNPDQIKKIDILDEFNQLNLNLGAGRLNGLNSMIRFFHNL